MSWLDEFSKPDEFDYGYSDFLDSVDTTLMGNNTYRQLQGWGLDFPYRDKANFIFTRNRKLNEDGYVKYISQKHIQFVKRLKADTGKDIWLIGGGEINTILLNERLIDELIIFIIRLF